MLSKKIKSVALGLGVAGLVAAGVALTPHVASANAPRQATPPAQATGPHVEQVVGKITAVQSNGFTLQNPKHTYAVTVNSNTWIVTASNGQRTQGALSDLKVGDTVHVAGVGTDTAIEARVVTSGKAAARVGNPGKHAGPLKGRVGQGQLKNATQATVQSVSGTTVTLAGKQGKTRTVNTDAGTIVIKGGLASVSDLKAGDVVNVLPRPVDKKAARPATGSTATKPTPTAAVIVVASDSNAFALGVVKSVDGTTLTVRTGKGEQKVSLSGSTAIRTVTGGSTAPTPAAASDLKAGTRVALYGTKPAAGQTAAASVVLILPQGKATK
jgi:hypothetical protein